MYSIWKEEKGKEDKERLAHKRMWKGKIITYVNIGTANEMPAQII
jgi:hypothetical protein